VPLPKLQSAAEFEMIEMIISLGPISQFTFSSRDKCTPEDKTIYPGNLSPNIGRPLLDCSRVASSWSTSQCSTKIPSLTRRMSAAIQFTVPAQAVDATLA